MRGENYFRSSFDSATLKDLRLFPWGTTSLLLRAGIHVPGVYVLFWQLARHLNSHRLEVPVQCCEFFAICMWFPCCVSEAPSYVVP